jgi:hypothetical protein
MGNRRLISYIVFAIGIVLFVLFGLLGDQLLTGVLAGLACLLVGVFFFRRSR